ncbi:hypothetical protein A4X13_0g9195, partial [Tilletia indica]
MRVAESPPTSSGGKSGSCWMPSGGPLTPPRQQTSPASVMGRLRMAPVCTSQGGNVPSRCIHIYAGLSTSKQSSPFLWNLQLFTWYISVITMIASLYIQTVRQYAEPSKRVGWQQRKLTQYWSALLSWSNNIGSGSVCAGSSPRKTKPTSRPAESTAVHSGASHPYPFPIPYASGSQATGDQQGGNDPDPRKNHTPERTHTAPNIINPVKTSPWSKLAQRWKDRQGTDSKPEPKTEPKPHPKPKKKGKGPSIKSRTFKPKQGMIQTSITANRPLVKAASQRFTTWVPATPVKVPRATRASSDTVRDVALAGFAAGTKRNYSVGLAQWHKYCDEHNIAEKRREPAAAHLVEHWVSLQAGDKSGGYLSDWISGLKAWHTLNNLPWLADDERLSIIRRGVTNLQPAPRPPREPMTVEWLDKLYHAAKRDDPAEMAVVAAAATGFWGLCRLGEIVSSSDVAERQHNITRAQAIESLAFGSVPTLTLRLPRTKTQPQGDTVVVAHQKEECDPIKLMHLHLQQSPCADKKAEATTPLFAYRGKRALVPLTRSKFLSTIGAIGRRAGIGPLHGHSMRIGGCTALLSRGVPPDRVQLHGRW